MQRGHLFVEGRVQGVGYRHFTKVQAREFGVFGWVKNLPDGRVEAVMEGPEDHILEVVNRCQKGPDPSRVDNIDLDWEEPTEEFNSFEIEYF